MRRRECRREREMDRKKEMLEPRGGLWSSGSVSDSQNRERNNQRKRGCGSGGGSGGGEVVVCRATKKIYDRSVNVLVD